MASRLPPELIELLLRSAYHPPGADDVDVERERARRRVLRSCALVSSRWASVATPMLSESVLLGGESTEVVDADVAAHVEGASAGSLDVSLTTCLTLNQTVLFQGVPLERARELAFCMPLLRFLRFRLFEFFELPPRVWPGQHLVVADADLMSYLPLTQMTEHSADVVSLTVRRPECHIIVGAAFAARAVSLHLGSLAHGLRADTPLRLEGALTSLRSMEVCFATFQMAGDLVERLGPGPTAAQMLERLVIGVTEARCQRSELDITQLGADVARLAVAVPATVVHFGLKLYHDGRSGTHDIYMPELVRLVADTLAGWIASAPTVTFGELSFDVSDCWVGRWGLDADSADELARACEARGVRLSFEI